MSKATITVHLQALGGKFLGPNAYEPNNIVLTLNAKAGSVSLPYRVVKNLTDDGSIAQGFADGSSSFMPILSMPALGGQNPAVFYLTPGANTIAGSAQFDLPGALEVAQLSASIPMPDKKNLHLSQPVVLQPLQTDYRITMVVPGLLLQQNDKAPIPGSISVFVTMMCGCKVTTGLPTSYWNPNDFTVTARVWYKGGTIMQYPLSLYGPTNDSLFSAAVPTPDQIQSILFWAQQKSTGNEGALVQGG
jgi:hypothetical protein